MKKLLFILSLICSNLIIAQGAHFHSYSNKAIKCNATNGMYVKGLGNQKAEPIIFLHGGPGYNCANFEATTAQKLADKGFYVIVYDRRGEGRSKDLTASFTFKETFDDINAIIKCHHLKKVNIMGHSFGGIVATLFAKAYPQKVKSLTLVGAPVNLQESFKTIIKASRKIYETNKDSVSLAYIDMLNRMDTTSMPYASYCFMNAMKNGFYSPKQRTDEAKKIIELLQADKNYPITQQMDMPPPQGFSDNEKYTTINLTEDLKTLTLSMGVYALYGKEDGLYSEKQIMDLKTIVGDANLGYYDNCSHNVFIDQQTAFINRVVEWLK